jgi:hypothetical protein
LIGVDLVKSLLIGERFHDVSGKIMFSLFCRKQRVSAILVSGNALVFLFTPETNMLLPKRF